jgi:small-conductance mechanosensitive channel
MASLTLDPTQYTDPIITVVNQILPKIPGLLFGLIFGLLIIRLLVRLTRLLLAFTSMQQGLKGIIVSVVEILLWVLLSISTLQELGFSGMITFFSSSALAIGILLAAGGSTLLADIVAGIFLAQDNDFGVGDEVMAGEDKTHGIVESMDARRTRIRDDKGVLHVLPNSVVERKEWILIHKRSAPNPLVKAVKTAKRLRTVSFPKKPGREKRNVTFRDNEL